MQVLWNIVWRLLKQLDKELLCDPTIPLLNTYPKYLKIGYSRDICIHMIIVEFSTIPKRGNQPSCPLMNVKNSDTKTQLNIIYPWKINTFISHNTKGACEP